MKRMKKFVQQGDANVSGTEYQSIDQRGMRAKFKCEDNRESFAMGGPYVACDSAEYKAIELLDRRKMRGGANYDKTNYF